MKLLSAAKSLSHRQASYTQAMALSGSHAILPCNGSAQRTTFSTISQSISQRSIGCRWLSYKISAYPRKDTLRSTWLIRSMTTSSRPVSSRIVQLRRWSAGRPSSILTSMGIPVTGTGAILLYYFSDERKRSESHWLLPVFGLYRSVVTILAAVVVITDYRILALRYPTCAEHHAQYGNFPSGGSSELPPGFVEYRKARDNAHYRSAQLLLNVCKMHRGLYTKAAQVCVK